MGSSCRPCNQQGGHILKQSQKQAALGPGKITPFLILLIKPTVFSLCLKQAIFFHQNIAVAQHVPHDISETPCHTDPTQQAENPFCLAAWDQSSHGLLFGFCCGFVPHTDTHPQEGSKPSGIPRLCKKAARVLDSPPVVPLLLTSHLPLP